jgi:hypothetical protein
MSKITTIVGLSFAIYFSSWFSDNTNTINDDRFCRCAACLYFNGSCHHYDDL